MAVSPKAMLDIRIAAHHASCKPLFQRQHLKNRDVQSKIRLTRTLHEEVLHDFFSRLKDSDQDLGHYYRLLSKLDELHLDLLSRATTYPTKE